jgi:outer membrane protein
MSFRMALRPLMVCSVLLCAGHLASAQVKIGVINLQKAVFDTAEIKKADAEMQAKYKPRQDKLQQTQEQIAKIAEQLQQGGGKLTPQQEADLQAQGTRLQKDGQRMQDDLQADVTADRNDILSKSTQKMNDVVKKIAEEKGLDLVVESSATLYVKPTIDITADATSAYDKAYPVGTTPAGK